MHPSDRLRSRIADIGSLRLQQCVTQSLPQASQAELSGAPAEAVTVIVSMRGCHLTAKSKALMPVLVALMQWGEDWVFEGDGPLRILDAERQEPIRKLGAEASDGRHLDIADF
ncbi:MAG: hypothetical protein ABL973_09110 [Micropepsaceae bacterium]